VSDHTRAHVFVSGTVQGVYYRASTRDAARDRGVDGWVKNRDDGRVEAVFEGEESAVEAMVEWCHTGSDAASVDGFTGIDVVTSVPWYSATTCHATESIAAGGIVGAIASNDDGAEPQSGGGAAANGRRPTPRTPSTSSPSTEPTPRSTLPVDDSPPP